MKLFILFGQRKQRYDGEYAPEALLCWDEFCVDENPEGFDKDVAETTKKYKDDCTAIKLFTIEVNGDRIAKILNETPNLVGNIVNE